MPPRSSRARPASHDARSTRGRSNWRPWRKRPSERCRRTSRRRASSPAPGAPGRPRRGAERIAAFYLRLKGWHILARRFQKSGGEIDIIARRGDTIAFVEVKRRTALDAAATSIDGTKRRHMARAARAFVSRQRGGTGFTYRADAIYLAPWHWPRHVPAAFDLDM